MQNQGVHGKSRFGVGLALTVLVVAGCGCGGRKGEVSGTVSYRGQPLPVGTVTFFGKDNQNVGSSAISEGKYKVSQVPPGSVKITVATPPPPGRTAGNAPPPPKDMPAPIASIAIPPKYSSPDQSGLTYEVKSGSQAHPIDLN